MIEWGMAPIGGPLHKGVCESTKKLPFDSRFIRLSPTPQFHDLFHAFFIDAPFR